MTGRKEPIEQRIVREIEERRQNSGQCRHCGGPVPCWSVNGDFAVGIKHTQQSHRAVKR